MPRSPSRAVAGKAAGLAAFLLILTAAPAFAACDVGFFKFYRWQTQANLSWRTAPNETCGVSFESHGQIGIGQFRIVAQPLHGGAVVVNQMSMHGFGYRPARGFAGHDHFQVSAVSYNGQQGFNTMRIDVDVDVAN